MPWRVSRLWPPVSFSTSVQPMMAFRGVRSSWETVERNSSFIRLAFSACSRAVRSRSSKTSRSWVIRRSSVMSRARFWRRRRWSPGGP